MLRVLTESGTTYFLSNGRVTRVPPVNNRLALPIKGECFRHLSPLVVGRGMVLRIPAIGSKPLVTTPVKEILPL